ncbi:MAG: type III pantothenate kinase [Oscillospiraceae bacterium]|nr:type III pantothenate kinase [Oscillospiraceae bacterium]
MLLCVDVGNTNIVFGMFADGQLRAKYRLATDTARSADEIGVMLTRFYAHAGLLPEHTGEIIVGSVVPPVMYTLRRALAKYVGCPVRVPGEDMDTGLVNLCEEPLGIDRAVSGIAACELYGAPVIVVDFGTATKADAFNAKGEYMGGVICPGIKISMDALTARAAMLPRVEIVKPRRVIGVNTVEQMQAGAVYGFVGGIERVVRQMCAEMGAQPPVVATGGLAGLIAAHTGVITKVDPDLTLHGLRIVSARRKVGC